MDRIELIEKICRQEMELVKKQSGQTKTHNQKLQTQLLEVNHQKKLSLQKIAELGDELRSKDLDIRNLKKEATLVDELKQEIVLLKEAAARNCKVFGIIVFREDV